MKPFEFNVCTESTKSESMKSGTFMSMTAMPFVLLIGGSLSVGSETVNDTVNGVEAAAIEAASDSSTSADLDPSVGVPVADEVIGPAVSNDPASLEERIEIEPEDDAVLSLTEESAKLGAAEGQATLDGYINLRSRSRWVIDPDGDDHDLFAVIGVNYDSGGPESWGAHLLLRGSWGLDKQAPDSVFFSVQDTYSNRVDARVYHAYIDAPVGDDLSLARIGRMILFETPTTAYFDGVQFETAPIGPTQFMVGAYGGLSVHQAEGWPSDEWMHGLYTGFRPWIDGRMRFDWMHFEDDNRFGQGSNDLVAGSVAHQVSDNLRLGGNYSLLNGNGNDFALDGNWVLPDRDLTVRVSYFSLLKAQSDLAFELNPFFNFLNTYSPYDETQLMISKAFSDDFDLYGGVASRRVGDEANIGRFNRDFDRYYLTASFPDLIPSNTTLSLTGESWDSPGNDIQTWGLDLSSRPTDDWKLSAGSYFSLYKYFRDVGTERDEVRTYFGEIRHSLVESTNLMLRYEYENEELDSFHSLILGVTWRF